jgi:hypothetical protein
MDAELYQSLNERLWPAWEDATLQPYGWLIQPLFLHIKLIAVGWVIVRQPITGRNYVIAHFVPHHLLALETQRHTSLDRWDAILQQPIPFSFSALPVQNHYPSNCAAMPMYLPADRQPTQIPVAATSITTKSRRPRRKVRHPHLISGAKVDRSHHKAKAQKSESSPRRTQKAKAAKTEPAHSGQIRSLSTGGDAAEFIEFAAAQTEWVESDSEEHSQNLFEIVGDPSLEPPTLDLAHPFAGFKDALVQHGLEVSVTKRNKDVHVRDLECNTDSEDRDWVNTTGQARFLCPFYQDNPKGHRECLKTADMTTILAVKQHVSREHRLPFYCPICYTIFAAPENMDDHLRERKCPRKEKIHIEGVSDEKVKLLARIPHSLPEAMQWLAIFKIVLPRSPLPRSVYLGDGIESVVVRLREFWGREGKQIVSEFVAQQVPEFQNHDYYGSIPDEERTLAALHSAVITGIVGAVMEKFEILRRDRRI